MKHTDKDRTAVRDNVYKAVYERLRLMCVKLQPDVENAIRRAAEIEDGLGKKVLEHIVRNIDTAEETRLPLCQDTGMVIGFIKRGEDFPLSDLELRRLITSAVENAYLDGYFRKSVVEDPVNGRKNTGTNLPAILYSESEEGDGLEISLTGKGFGSENCSYLFMLKPTAGRDAVVDAVTEAVQKAGASPCPPVVVGVGVGGTSDYAMVMSKKALFRKLDDRNPDPFYAEMEEAILNRANTLNIGPGGLGGKTTALAVKIEHYPTHIAGLPVGVSICCWADRKFAVRFNSIGEVLK